MRITTAAGIHGVKDQLTVDFHPVLILQELVQLAAPEHDKGALDQDVRQAIALGRERARASAEARLARGPAGKP